MSYPFKDYKEYRFKFNRSAWYYGDAIDEDVVVAKSEESAYSILKEHYSLKKEDVVLLSTSDMSNRNQTEVNTGVDALAILK